jgi:hypothetical protein
MPVETSFLLSPNEAASGTSREVRVPGGGDRTVTVLFPPGLKGGSVVQVDAPDGPFLIRLMVASSFLSQPPVKTGEGIPAVLVSGPVPLQPGPAGGAARKSSGGNRLAAQLAVVAVAIGLVIAFAVYRTSHTSDDAGSAGGSSVITIGSCLSGTLPDSTTARSVSGIKAVSCSSSDAHYKVVNSFSSTTDMTRCQSVPNSQYAFTETTTLNGFSSEILYCVAGLGSYAH